MKIEIDIPREFGDHFRRDRFEDSLRRLHADAEVLAGRYEKEVARMLIKAFRLARITDDKAGRKTDVQFSLYRIPDAPDEEPG